MIEDNLQITGDKKSTVVGGWSVAVARALSHLGCDGEALLNEAGTSSRQNCTDELYRHTSDQTRLLWELAKKETGLESIGLEVANHVCPTTFHALGFSLWASSTLMDALKRMVRFEVLLNDGCQLGINHTSQDQTHFSMQVKCVNGKSLIAPEGVDYFLGAVVKMFSDMSGGRINLISVNLARSEPKVPETWQKYFKCPVLFSAAKNELVFSQHDLTAQLPTGNEALAEQNDKLVEDYLAQMQVKDLFSQVQTALIELMPLGITTLEEIADSLSIAPRTLQYKLSQQGTTLQKLRDQTREELARKYLAYSRKSFTQIAYSLGFSDPAHFNRAFKRWTGETPTAYRQRMLLVR